MNSRIFMLAVIVLGMGLTACNKGDSNSSSSPTPPAPQQRPPYSPFGAPGQVGNIATNDIVVMNDAQGRRIGRIVNRDFDVQPMEIASAQFQGKDDCNLDPSTAKERDLGTGIGPNKPSVALVPGKDHFLMHFDGSGNLSIMMANSMGQYNPVSAVDYFLNQGDHSIRVMPPPAPPGQPAGAPLFGSPSSVLVSIESELAVEAEQVRNHHIAQTDHISGPLPWDGGVYDDSGFNMPFTGAPTWTLDQPAGQQPYSPQQPGQQYQPFQYASPAGGGGLTAFIKGFQGTVWNSNINRWHVDAISVTQVGLETHSTVQTNSVAKPCKLDFQDVLRHLVLR